MKNIYISNDEHSIPCYAMSSLKQVFEPKNNIQYRLRDMETEHDLLDNMQLLTVTNDLSTEGYERISDTVLTWVRLALSSCNLSKDTMMREISKTSPLNKTWRTEPLKGTLDLRYALHLMMENKDDPQYACRRLMEMFAPVFANDYAISYVLGSGNFGTVCRAIRKNNTPVKVFKYLNIQLSYFLSS